MLMSLYKRQDTQHKIKNRLKQIYLTLLENRAVIEKMRDCLTYLKNWNHKILFSKIYL